MTIPTAYRLHPAIMEALSGSTYLPLYTHPLLGPAQALLPVTSSGESCTGGAGGGGGGEVGANIGVRPLNSGV